MGKVEDCANSSVKDAYYVACGKDDKVLKSTWVRMGNFGRGHTEMKARFDRQLYSGIGINVPSGGFSLIGKKKMDFLSTEMSNQRGYSTPSDHFGLAVDYFISEV